MTTRVLIVGAGGHAQVVADIMLQAGPRSPHPQPIGYLDDNPAFAGQTYLGVPVLGLVSQWREFEHDGAVIAIGDNATRKLIFTRFQTEGARLLSVIHPSAIVGSSVQVGLGCMLCAGSIVNPASSVGANVILNTGCTVDHHNQIGDHAHIAPGAHLGGEVRVGEGALIGIGATVMPRCRVGAWAIVGAGAVVTHDIPDYTTVLGVPAHAVAGSRSVHG